MPPPELLRLRARCIPCKPHAGGTPVASQVYAKVKGWRSHEVQRSKEPCAEICFLLPPRAKDYSLGNIHAATPMGKLTPRRRSWGLSAWNAPWTESNGSESIGSGGSDHK